MGKLCKTKGCIVSANYGYVGGKRQYCRAHSLKGMTKACTQFCIQKQCLNVASYGIKNTNGITSNVTHCGNHKSPDMVKSGVTRCEATGCGKRPIYGYPNRSPLYCFEHKKKDHVNRCSKQCKTKGCYKYPRYGFHSTNIYCTDHKRVGMHYITSNLCKHPGCTTQGTFGFNGKGQYCSKHKTDNMVSRKKHKLISLDSLSSIPPLVPLSSSASTQTPHKMSIFRVATTTTTTTTTPRVVCAIVID
jgi:hypothetical protein